MNWRLRREQCLYRAAAGRLPVEGRAPRGGGKEAAEARPLRRGGAGTGLGRLPFIMDAAEVEFLAEKELVTIIPNFSLDKIYLIGVSQGGTGLRPGVMLGSPLLSKPGVCVVLAGGPGTVQPRLTRGRAPVAGHKPETETEVPSATSRVDGCG